MNRRFRNIFCVLLCLVMALSLTGTALAYDGSEGEQDITIRITPPSGWATQRAEVEVRVTPEPAFRAPKSRWAVGRGRT